MKTALSKVKKAIGALLGGATGVGVAEILAAFHVNLPIGASGAVATVLALLGTYLAPANAVDVPPVVPATATPAA